MPLTPTREKVMKNDEGRMIWYIDKINHLAESSVVSVSKELEKKNNRKLRLSYMIYLDINA